MPLLCRVVVGFVAVSVLPGGFGDAGELAVGGQFTEAEAG